MNRTLTLALALTAIAALPPVFAQSPAPKPAAPVPTAGSTPEPARPPAAREAAAGTDPRLCLEFTSNSEIIRCAEKYRRHPRTG